MIGKILTNRSTRSGVAQAHTQYTPICRAAVAKSCSRANTALVVRLLKEEKISFEKSSCETSHEELALKRMLKKL